MDLLQSLKNRYATKVFDNTKKISENDLSDILEAFRLSTSSFWLQPWKLIIVENTKLREELLPNSWNQNQVIDASHLLVFAQINNPWDELIKEYIDDTAKTRNLKTTDLESFEWMMKWFLDSKTTQEKNIWASKQVYIALWSLIVYLASKNIDSCPMEWINPQKYDEILWLEKLGLSTVVALPIWYRSDNDKYASLPKVRFWLDKIIIRK